MTCRRCRKDLARYGVECVDCWVRANPTACSEVMADYKKEMRWNVSS